MSNMECGFDVAPRKGQQIDIPLLRKEVEWVEAQAALPLIDREWYQDLWFATATHKAEDLLGDVDFSTISQRWTKTEQIARHCGTGCCLAGHIGLQYSDEYLGGVDVGDSGVHIRHFAANLLGINEGQASALFNGSNDAADIRRIAEKIAGQPL